MIKQIIVTACFFLTLASFAQSGSASPYSYFGIGESRFKGNHENRSMSGVAIEQDSIHMNILNPASFAAIKLTTFTVGSGYTSTKIKSDKGDANAQRTTLDYLAIALPLGKMGVGFGLLPYTSVGYNIESVNSGLNGNNNRLTGSGGLNKAFLGLGYTVAPNFVVGADIQYNFGSIKNSNLEFTTAIPIGTQVDSKADLTGLSMNFGAMYQGKINKNLNYYGSATFMPGSTLVSNTAKTISTVQYDANFALVINDFVDLGLIRKDIKIPAKITLGAGIGQSRKWLLGTQIAYQMSNGGASGVNNSKNTTYGEQASYSLGGYYIPNYNLYSKYYQKITYRAGLKYSKTGIITNSKSIDEMGVTLGFGLPSPYRDSMSNFNIGLEYGKRGTTSNGLIQENYVSLSLSFSLNEKWFRQSKFN